MKYEIHKTLVVSTGHITKEDSEFLSVPHPSSLIIYPMGDYGWWIFVGERGMRDCDMSDEEVIDEGGSEDLVRLIKLAREQGCTWLMLDRDGPVYDDLNEYHW